MKKLAGCVGPYVFAALATVVIACGSSEGNESGAQSDASARREAGTDASLGNPDSGRGTGSGGTAGSGGDPVGGAGAVPLFGAGGRGAGGAGAGGALGAGCALAVDAGSDLPAPTTQMDAPDASLVMDLPDAGGRDASVSDAGIRRDASLTDAGNGSDSGTYPPLQFSKIGRPVTVSSQFLFAEGPVWDPRKQVLYFTDINGDAVYRLTLPDTFDVFIDHIGNADGLALDPDGNLVGAGFVSRDIWAMQGSRVVSLVSQYRGRKLNSPDEVIVRSDGVIYFTDPSFGIDGSQGFAGQRAELCFQGVYRLTTDGELHLEDQSLAGPNGIQLSPDQKLLYVSYTTSGEVDAFDVAADGSLSGKRRFATGVTTADSMTVDAAGDLYVASLTGITVLDPTGRRLGVITTSQVPTNAAFGGPNLRTLFITARSLLALVPSKGTSSLMRVDDMPIPGLPGVP